MRTISGPQGPRVLLDGKPVLLLSSDNYLGLADHPQVREAAADAAMRYGAGAGAARTASGSMRIHRRLEERVAEFTGSESALVFGSRYLANVGVIPALAGPGEMVLCDAHNHHSSADGCRLARAETFVYHHGDLEHLAWGLAQAEGRASLIVTDGVFGVDGDVAPLAGVVDLAERYDTRLLVDDSHGFATSGPGGRGSSAAAGLEREIDVLVSSLGKGLGSYGAVVGCDRQMARYLAGAAATMSHSTALPPPAVAAAMAALSLLREDPRRVEKLTRNAATLRDALAREGLSAVAATGPIVSLPIVGAKAAATSQRAIERGIFAQHAEDPQGIGHQSRLRLSVMATHTRTELREAARTLATVVPSADRARATQVARLTPAQSAVDGVFDGLARAA